MENWKSEIGDYEDINDNSSKKVKDIEEAKKTYTLQDVCNDYEKKYSQKISADNLEAIIFDYVHTLDLMYIYKEMNKGSERNFDKETKDFLVFLVNRFKTEREGERRRDNEYRKCASISTLASADVEVREEIVNGFKHYMCKSDNEEIQKFKEENFDKYKVFRFRSDKENFYTYDKILKNIKNLREEFIQKMDQCTLPQVYKIYDEEIYQIFKAVEEYIESYTRAFMKKICDDEDALIPIKLKEIKENMDKVRSFMESTKYGKERIELFREYEKLVRKNPSKATYKKDSPTIRKLIELKIKILENESPEINRYKDEMIEDAFLVAELINEAARFMVSKNFQEGDHYIFISNSNFYEEEESPFSKYVEKE